ncbi:MAG: histidine phosphatase family protein [Saprospiraceae bacterium]|nr:histidine phosphatase family protein [Saprospiraceae bacterium]
MKKLHLIRHAKSSWDHPGLSDMDRPLNTRGLRDAAQMAELLKKQLDGGLQMVSSPATRALNTALIFNQTINPPGSEIIVKELLYFGNEDDYLDIVRSADPDIESIAIFGHNPIIEYFVMKTKNGILEAIPTCAIICFKTNNNGWSETKWEDLEMVEKYYPRDRSS